MELLKNYLIFAEIGVDMPEITVISEKDRMFSKVPGAVTFIDKRELKALSPTQW